MASFKVGQRVKKIAHANEGGIKKIPLGTEGTIVGVDCEGRDWRMCWDGYGATSGINAAPFTAYSRMLAPLTDPNAEWADSAVKKLVERCKTEITELAL